MVTGASSGLGRQLCLDLAKAGCMIVAAARRVDRLASLCEEINSMNTGSSAVAVELDLNAKWDVIEASVRKAWDAFGSITALINNAGVRGTVSSPIDLSEDEWNRTLQTNLTGTWLVSKFIARHMCQANKKGSIISISSISGLDRGLLPGGSAYAVSKAGINILTRAMALELGPHNIRVNSISPGLFRSEITEKLMEKKWLNNVARRTVPLRTWGAPDPAITSLVRYLIHDSSDYVSGNIFIVDAGATLPGFPIFSSL